MSSEQQLPPPTAMMVEEQTKGTEPTEKGELFTRLRSQVEFYFSPQNLARDTYLRNMLTVEQHVDMPSPRPMQFMCPVGIITSFPKVKNICSQCVTGEPVAVILGKALDGSNIVISDGNWIGPVNQSLPPPVSNVMGGGPMMGMAGQLLPPRGQPPSSFQPHPYQIQQQGYMPNHMQGMMGMAYPSPPIQQGEVQGMIYQQQPPSAPPQYVMGPPNVIGTESPSSASVESLPSQQQQLQQPQHHQQQQQTQLQLDTSASSRLSVGNASVASLSSVSGPGGGPVTGQMGQHGALPLPSGGISPSLAVANSGVTMPPTQGIPLPFPGPGQPPPYPMGPYYNPQQIYPPGGYMQHTPQQGQVGPPPPMMQMGYGPGGIPPQFPPQQYQGYPANGPPPPYPIQAMQQYVDYGGGAPQQYRYHPQQHHQQQYHDYRHRVGSPGFHHNNDHHHSQHHHGMGNKNNPRRNNKPKKKNHQNNHQSHRNGSHGSGSFDHDHNGHRYNQNYARNDHSRSPPPHQGGENRPNWKKSFDEHQQQYRRNHSSSQHYNNSNNRYQNHHDCDRISGSSDTSNQRPNKIDSASRDIFTSSDFPGLAGGGEGDTKPNENSNLVGYASALLKKKKEAERLGSDDTDATPNSGKIDVAPTKSIESVDNNEVDRLTTRQTEEMEREILSEFHDLSLVGNDDDIPLPHCNKHAGSNDGTTELTAASSSTLDTKSSQSRMPILPAPFEDVDYASTISRARKYSASEQTEPAKKVEAELEPPIDGIRNSQAEILPSKNAEEEPPADEKKPKSPVVWGSKSFAEVRMVSNIIASALTEYY